MSAVTLLTAANVADAGAGDPVDVSAGGTLRLDWTVKANHGKNPQVELSIETAPAATGPWTQVWRRLMCAEKPATATDMNSNGWHTQPRALVPGVDRFARARWSGCARKNVELNSTTAEFNIACAGEVL